MAISDNIYDVVIIGSGLGGMVCGTILSKEGKRVCIIEKNEQIGGCLQTFKREGITFDTGVHYIGGLSPGQNLYKIFNYLGIMNRLELSKMSEDGFDVVCFKGDEEEYPYGNGYDNFKRLLLAKFPDERKALEKYCRDMQDICAAVPLYNLRPETDVADVSLYSRSAKEYFDHLTANKKLQQVLAGTNLLYAGVADKTPLYVHALVVNSYIESAHKCREGGDQIVKLMARVIREYGGDILRKKKVTKIYVEENTARYVELEDGSKIYGDTFISNIHPSATLALTDTAAIRSAFRQRVCSLQNSISTFVLYAIMKPGTFPYHNRNYYWFDEADVWKGTQYMAGNWPYTYAFFEGVPQQQSKHTEALTIMTYMRYEEVQLWEETFHTTLDENMRNEAYQVFKKQKAERLLDTVSFKFPNIRDCIQSYYTSTPLSYRDYMGTLDGSMYGIAKDYNEPIKTMISAKTKVPNLLLTGQNLNLHGVMGVTESALVTCMALLGREYLISKIHEANAQTV